MEKPLDLLEVEVKPRCDHLFQLKRPDGSKWCWICGEDVEEPSSSLVALATPGA